MMFSYRKRRLAKKVVCSVLLLAPLLVLLCAPVSALEILYPVDGTYVTKSDYLIIKGGTDPYLSGFSVEINGVKSEVIDVTSDAYREVFDDMLIVEPIFDPGPNKIVVEGYLNDELMEVAKAEVYYHDNFTEPPPDMPKYAFHKEEQEAECSGCHDMSPSPQALANPDPRSNPCGSCHRRMLNKKHVHGPAGVFECTYCHDVDSTPVKYQPRINDGELCLECHEDKLEKHMKAKFVHGPVEAGLCMACHDPHASDEPAQLTMPAFELCSSCHEKVSQSPHVVRGSSGQRHPLKGVVNPAGKGEDLSCASCHDPHSGQTNALFRWGVTSRMSLCAKCHAK